MGELHSLLSAERERAAHCAVNSLKYLNKSLLCANEEKLKPEQFPALSARLFHFQQKTLFAAKSDVILTLAHYSHTELPLRIIYTAKINVLNILQDTNPDASIRVRMLER